MSSSNSSHRASASWWNEECEEAADERRKALHNFKKKLTYDNYLELKSAEAAAKRTFRKAKKKQQGSKKPEEVKGQARLYSMKYCPFAHRVRLILTLKQIPHDIVNINLQNKPDWYFQIHPEGKVPAFVDADGTVITDSVEIANYLNQKYPVPPLYNDESKSHDLELLDHFSKIIDTFSNCIHDKDKRSFEVILVETMDNLQEFEEELGIRKTPFFGGNNPGMLDILMWPWFERAKALTILYKQRASLDKERFPNLMDWLDEMKNQWFVEEHKCSYEKFAKFIEASKAGNADYDNI